MKVKNIRIEYVFVSEFNCRKNLDDLDIESLANSIERYGLFQNIVVLKRAKNHYKVIIGQRRLLAFKMLGRKTIPAKILEEVDDLDALAISLQEDIHKVGLTPLDKARAFKTLCKLLGKDVSKVAVKVALSVQTVKNYLKMLNIEDAVKRKIDQGKIKLPVKTLVKIPDLPKDKQEIVAKQIQNYPGDVQRIIIRELKANPSKLKIIEQKELMANFIQKLITFRLPRLQDVSQRFFDDLREIEHKFRNMTERFPILRVTLDFHLHSFHYSRDRLERIVHEFDDVMSFRARQNRHNPLDLLDAVLEDFRRNTQDYNSTIISDLLNDVMEMVVNDIFDKNILETLKVLRSNFSEIIDNKLPELLKKIVDIRIPAADRIELFKTFEELYLNDYQDLIKLSLYMDSENSYFLRTILARLTLQPHSAKVFKEIPDLLVYLYMISKDEGIHKNLVSILRKIGKLCSTSGCTALTNLFKDLSEIKFCSSCKGIYCDTCFDKHPHFLKCGNCGKHYCYNCHDFCEPLSDSLLENEICEICYEEGKYEDAEAICRECVIQVSPCYVCGKRLCTKHRRYKASRVLCSECYDDYEEEEEVEENNHEFDDDIFDILEENYTYIEEFLINDYITLKLADNNQIDLFVNGKLFNQCMYLFFNISEDNYKEYKYIDSIDEAAENLDASMEGEGRIDMEISPETEFWGHCSNLQVWAENNYDTRLIHRNLAFPLLKRLTEVGDPIARRVFKEEIAKRIESGHLYIITFLLENNYFKFLNNNELKIVFENTAEKIKRNILNSLTSDSSSQIKMAINILKKIEEINLESDENDKSTEDNKDE